MRELLEQIQEYVAAQTCYGTVVAVGLPKLIDHSKYGFWFDGKYAPPEWNYTHTVSVFYQSADLHKPWEVLIGITSADRVRLDEHAPWSVWQD